MTGLVSRLKPRPTKILAPDQAVPEMKGEGLEDRAENEGRFFAPETGAQNDTTQAHEQALRVRRGTLTRRNAVGTEKRFFAPESGAQNASACDRGRKGPGSVVRAGRRYI